MAQTFDAVIISWTGLGSEPDDSAQFSYRNDIPGAGFNFVSYYNPIGEDNLTAARSLEGCHLEERGALYRDNQIELHDDLPYAFLYVPTTNIVATTDIIGIDANVWSIYHNVQEWTFVP